MYWFAAPTSAPSGCPSVSRRRSPHSAEAATCTSTPPSRHWACKTPQGLRQEEQNCHSTSSIRRSHSRVSHCPPVPLVLPRQSPRCYRSHLLALSLQSPRWLPSIPSVPA